MEKRMVYHHNLIGHEINESLEYFANDVLDREIYCRKKHAVTEPLTEDCMTCPCFAGVEQGHGIECAWEDIIDESVIKHEDRYKEYERVDKLMKLGVLCDVTKDLTFMVKDKVYNDKEWIYKQTDDKKNRFLLGKRGKKTLICCGVNPSVASPEDLDPTMKNVEKFAEKHGYDSYLMINLYPMRATNPDDMHPMVDEDIVKANLEYIEEILATEKCDIWAAWGTLIKKRRYLKDCLKQIVDIADKYECTWYTIGDKSKEGHPHHPLYLSQKCEMEVFDVHTYLKCLK